MHSKTTTITRDRVYSFTRPPFVSGSPLQYVRGLEHVPADAENVRDDEWMQRLPADHLPRHWIGAGGPTVDRPNGHEVMSAPVG